MDLDFRMGGLEEQRDGISIQIGYSLRGSVLIFWATTDWAYGPSSGSGGNRPGAQDRSAAGCFWPTAMVMYVHTSHVYMYIYHIYLIFLISFR
jgi:hypothetical protein